jgi:hypothetical protein
MQSRDSRPFDRYFPELRQALVDRLPEQLRGGRGRYSGGRRCR